MNAADRPIQATRAQYETTRHKAREQAGPREDQSLPHHPDGSGLAPCAYCDGQGIVERRHWDPQLDQSWPCPECAGRGDIPDGWRDPLLRLRYARQPRNRRRNPAGYQYLRRLCATPSPTPASPSRDAPTIPSPDHAAAGDLYLEKCA